jgi:hypothetical protein
MKKIFSISAATLSLAFLICFNFAEAQVKIGDNPNTINSNSILELESTNKGLLPPRVALTSVSNISPLSGTVPTGMLVYSTGGAVADGYYYWDGSQWIPFKGETGLNTKIADATLTKNEKFILASNSITITLPAITAADNGLSISIKNIGAYTDQVTVVGNGAATIDGISNTQLYRWVGKTFVAYGGNWIIKGNEFKSSHNVFDVSENSSWTTLDEILEFLDLHMSGPSVIRLLGGDYEITTSLVIDLDYPLTIQGSSYGTSNIIPGGSLSGPMFRCLSETYFKMLAFDATAAAGFGDSSGEDAIQLETGGEYFEIKDCTFDGFNKAIVAESNVEVWVFEVDIINSVEAGIELDAAGTTGVTLKISETDFTDCEKGINLISGEEPIASILNCGFYGGDSTDIGINYDPSTFTDIASMFIANNTWNNVGVFTSGFDFTRSDGRDADTFIKNNSGGQDQNPRCRINVNNNATTTSIANAGTWYKANWTNTASVTTKWTIGNNKITYQPQNISNGWMIITGDISVGSNNRTISIGIVKNGNTAVIYGETELRVTNANQPFQFATTIYLTDIGPDDYFELYATSAHNGDVVTFQDVQWFTETK